MKKILVPTDFSNNAANALDYAFEISKLTGAEVVIINIFHMPVAGPTMPLSLLNTIEEDAREDAQKRMKVIIDQLNKEGKTNYECIISGGFMVDEIISFARKLNIDLIVMGTKGANGLVEEFIGSNTATLIEEREFPVLAIPSNARFKANGSIVLASDYHKFDDSSLLNPMLELAKAMKVPLNVLYIDKHPEEMDNDKMNTEAHLESLLYNFKPVFHFSADSNVTRGIDEFVKEENPALLVMISRKKSFLQQLFGKSHTKQMVYHTHVPLLVLPEKQNL